MEQGRHGLAAWLLLGGIGWVIACGSAGAGAAPSGTCALLSVCCATVTTAAELTSCSNVVDGANDSDCGASLAILEQAGACGSLATIDGGRGDVATHGQHGARERNRTRDRLGIRVRNRRRNRHRRDRDGDVRPRRGHQASGVRSPLGLLRDAHGDGPDRLRGGRVGRRQRLHMLLPALQLLREPGRLQQLDQLRGARCLLRKAVGVVGDRVQRGP